MDLKKHEKERVVLQEPIKLSGLKVAMLQAVMENEGIGLKNLRDIVTRKVGIQVSLPYYSKCMKELENDGIIRRERSYPHYIFIDEPIKEPLTTYLNALLILSNTVAGAEARELLKKRLEIDQRLKTIAPTLITQRPEQETNRSF